MKFIKVTNRDGNSGHINLDQITMIDFDWDGSCIISFSDKGFIRVTEEEWQRIYKIIYGDED